MAERVDILIAAKDKASKKLNAVQGHAGKLRSAFMSLGTVLPMTIGVAGFVMGTKRMIGAASDTWESLNKVREVFGTAAKAVEDFADRGAVSLGASRQETLAMTGEIGNLLVAFGLTEDAAADMSMDVVQLAADLGSFNNVPTTQALMAIRSALVGEAEPMKRFGSDVRQERLNQFALAEGIEFAKGKMDAQTKALVAMKVIMQDTAKAHGDFARTSDGLANSQRILAANFNDLLAVMGEQLIPVAGSVVSIFNDLVKSITQSDFEKTILQLQALGANKGMIKRLELQFLITETVRDEAKLRQRIRDDEIRQFSLLEKIWSVGRNIETERFKILAKELEPLAKIAKHTKDTTELYDKLSGYTEKIVELYKEKAELQSKGATEYDKQVLEIQRQLNNYEAIHREALEIIGLIEGQKTGTERLVELQEKLKNFSIEEKDQKKAIVTTTEEQLIPLSKQTLEIRGQTRSVEQEIVVLKKEELDLQEASIRLTRQELIASVDFWKESTQQFIGMSREVAYNLELFHGWDRALLSVENTLSRIAERLAQQAILSGLGWIIGAAIGGPVGAAIGGAISGGYQYGGSFAVGGQGGPDSQLVAFRASPGEHVAITPQGQVTNNATTVNYHINAIDARSFRDFMRRDGYKVMLTDLGRDKW